MQVDKKENFGESSLPVCTTAHASFLNTLLLKLYLAFPCLADSISWTVVEDVRIEICKTFLADDCKIFPIDNHKLFNIPLPSTGENKTDIQDFMTNIFSPRIKCPAMWNPSVVCCFVSWQEQQQQEQHPSQTQTQPPFKSISLSDIPSLETLCFRQACLENLAFPRASLCLFFTLVTYLALSGGFRVPGQVFDKTFDVVWPLVEFRPWLTIQDDFLRTFAKWFLRQEKQVWATCFSDLFLLARHTCFTSLKYFLASMFLSSRFSNLRLAMNFAPSRPQPGQQFQQRPQPQQLQQQQHLLPLLSKPVRLLVSGILPTCASLLFLSAFAYLNEYQERRKNNIHLYSKAFLNGAKRVGQDLAHMLETPPSNAVQARETWDQYQAMLKGTEPFVTRYVLSATSGRDLAQAETKFSETYLRPSSAEPIVPQKEDKHNNNNNNNINPPKSALKRTSPGTASRLKQKHKGIAQKGTANDERNVMNLRFPANEKRVRFS